MLKSISSDSVYLKSGTKTEPLAARWYAWSHLVAPLQHALHIAFRHVPTLRSFIADPSAHAAAARDPAFLCAPILQLTEIAAPEVRQLLATTTRTCAHLIGFANDLLSFDRQLQEYADGYDLEALYRKLPQSLSGLVELIYDLNNHPRMRIVEELLYEGGLQNQDVQAIALSRVPDEDREFFLNTPRLDTGDRMVLPIHFADPALEQLAQSRVTAASFSALCAALRVPLQSDVRFYEFFTTAAPRRNNPGYRGPGIRVRYFGHACVLLQTARVSILIDPVVAWDPHDNGRLTFNDLPDHIDYVFLTHHHSDHFCVELLLQLRGRIGRILVPRSNPMSYADPSMKLVLRNLGFSNVDILEPLQRIELEDGCMTTQPFFGEHASLDVTSKHALHLRLLGRTFLFLADADCADRVLYRRLTAILGKVEVLFIGMECDGAPLTWLYGPYLPNPPRREDDESRRLSGSDCERAWAVVQEVGCHTAFVYAMGQEPWLKHLLGLQYSAGSKQIVESDKFVERCKAASIAAERLNGTRDMFF